MQPPALWLAECPPAVDMHVALRGRFILPSAGRVELRTAGASWYDVYLDGQWLTEGPLRCPASLLEYGVAVAELARGAHLLAVHLHYDGVETRMLPDLPAFWWCEAFVDGARLDVAWSAVELRGYQRALRRVNPILGWIEWCDTRESPVDWREPAFDDAAWPAAAVAAVELSQPQAPSVGNVQRVTRRLTPVAQGALANTFGGPTDDIPARFFLRALDDAQQPVEGVWRRYDLGRVRLGRAELTLEAPAGAEIEIAYCEALQHDRVSPYINWSCGPSCNLDHYVARGGRQTFGPLTPRGGRFFEVHVLAPPDQVRFECEAFHERVYYGAPTGALSTGDAQLDTTWSVGVETLRACAEDAITDNPTRERGQWIGDSVSVGMEVAAAAYGDLRPFRRALCQAAQCANADGLVAGLCPGTNLWLASYACHWTSACVRYFELTGDRELLKSLHSAALRNVAAFERHLTPDGLTTFSDWVFIDWGYLRDDGPTDLTFDLMYLGAVRAMLRWNALLDKAEGAERLREWEQSAATTAQTRATERLNATADGLGRLNMHQAAFALRLGLLSPADEARCVAGIKRHIAGCFPYDLQGPRLSDPYRAYQQILTPFFAHFILPPLVDRGEMDFVLDVVRRCWGWALDQGLTTWPEVFDMRWSHCHEWSGMPTWLLSRYVLGLNPRYDLGERHYELSLTPGSVAAASGSVPLVNSEESVDVRWKRCGGDIAYEVKTPTPMTLHIGDRFGNSAGSIAIDAAADLTMRVD